MVYIFIGYVIVIFLRYYGFIEIRDELSTRYLIKNNVSFIKIESNNTMNEDYRRRYYSL